MDYLFRGIAKQKKVRILGIDATNSISKIVAAHETLPLTTVAFAKFLLGGTIIGALEKNNNGITMQINSDGPIKSLFMQATSNGLIRGYVSNPGGDLELKENEYSINKVIGENGILSVTKIVDGEHDFTSDVILTASDISQDIAYYFFASEQIPTIINLQVELDDNGIVKEAKGYLIQLLTGYEKEDVEDLEKIKQKRITNLEDNIKEMFDDFEKLEELEVRDICDCSKERFLTRLATLPDEDLKDLASEDIEVICQFCKSKFIFTQEELVEIINKRK